MNAFAHASTAPAGPELDGRRILAAVIDLALVILGGVVLTTIVSTLAGGDGGFASTQVRAVMVAWALYYFFALESGDGQTIGKKVMKLRVVSADGSALGMREVAIRTVLRVVDVFAGLIVMIATRERRQRLGDLAAGTMVADASAVPADTAVAAATAPTEPLVGADEPLPFDEAPAAADEPAPFAPPEAAGAPEIATPDVGTPLPGAAPSESNEPPALEDFDPYSLTQPSEPTDEPALSELSPIEPASPAPSPTDEPVAEDSGDEAREYSLGEGQEDEPALGDALPSEPSLGEPAFPAAAPAEEPAPDQPSAEEEPAPDQPSAEEPAADEPPAEQPAGPTPEESLAQLMGGQASKEAPADEADEPDEPAEDADAVEDQDEDVRVRPVETMSAIDMVMGGDDENRPESPEGDEGREQQDQ
jgi:uncharacterized RDD family membrane protein YckC